MVTARGAAASGALFILLACAARAQEFRIYVGDITPTSVLIAWGKTRGNGNTIGRDSTSYGKAEVKVGDRSVATTRNWVTVERLRPDTSYEYSVQVDGKSIGGGQVRTWAQTADRLAFFVIGDYGTGSSKQVGVADAMWKEFERRSATDNPVRFVLTVGDNIYSNLNLGYISTNSGDEDSHWEKKFFIPYAQLIRQIPFYATVGNHDGNGSEHRADLAVYLDNFFFPGGKPARWYAFSYGGLADFFGLDSSDNTLTGPPRPAYEKDGEQSTWLAATLPASRAPWKIVYMHHPIFNAGPRHGASREALAHWFELFRKSGVRVVFAGHEHNLQFSEDNEATGGMLHVITGAGGELRSGNVSASMERAHIALWASQRHFMAVEIRGRSMSITPLAGEEVVVRDKTGKAVPMPVVVKLP